jgi:hypothetical protein
MKNLETKTLCFDWDEDSKIVEVSEWQDGELRADINLPEGEYEISEDILRITTDYGTIWLRFPEKITKMPLMFPNALNPLIIKKKDDAE